MSNDALFCTLSSGDIACFIESAKNRSAMPLRVFRMRWVKPCWPSWRESVRKC